MLEQTEARRAEKKFFLRPPPTPLPPPLSQGVDDPHPSPTGRSGSAAAIPVSLIVGTKSYVVWCEHNLREGYLVKS